MNKEELYEMLAIDDGSEFEYFENFADLMECEEEIEVGAICKLLEELDMKTFVELCNNYFAELMSNFPDDMELYTLFINIKRSFMGMAKSCDEEGMITKLAQEIDRFRYWFVIEEGVDCSFNSGEKVKICSICEALALERVAAIDNISYVYDFSAVVDYELDEYIMSFSDLISEEDEYVEEGIIS